MQEVVVNALKDLISKGVNTGSKEWQSIKLDPKNEMIEIDNVFLKLPYTINPVEDYQPDLPWADDHFKERVCGEPINPGKQYLNWPYYKGLDNDILFRSGGKFSHNYMERIWCKGNKGLRFEYGDLNDVIERINKEPTTRQAFLSIWHPEDQSNNEVRVPCTIGYWFKLINGELTITYLIRSCDAVRHLRNDLYMTYLLLKYVASKTSLPFGNINIWIGSLHCFKSDIYTLNKLINK